MKVKFTYEVELTCDEDDASKAEAALEKAARACGSDISVTETDAEDLDDEDDS